MLDTVKLQKLNVKMVAHRGLSGIETENTAAAFIAAGNRSYYGIETDIHKTADGKFVCMHDDNAKRVSGKRCNILKKTLKEASAIKLKDFYCGTGPRCDLVPPALEDYISICKKYGKHAVLELKDVFDLQDLKKIIKIIKKNEYLENTTFISFYPQNVMGIRELLPTQSCQFLAERVIDEILKGVVALKVDIDIKYSLLTEDLVKYFHSNGVKVNCWTVDSKEEAEKLVSWGVDYITTNILE